MSILYNRKKNQKSNYKEENTLILHKNYDINYLNDIYLKILNMLIEYSYIIKEVRDFGYKYLYLRDFFLWRFIGDIFNEVRWSSEWIEYILWKGLYVRPS